MGYVIQAVTFLTASPDVGKVAIRMGISWGTSSGKTASAPFRLLAKAAPCGTERVLHKGKSTAPFIPTRWKSCDQGDPFTEKSAYIYLKGNDFIGYPQAAYGGRTVRGV